MTTAQQPIPSGFDSTTTAEQVIGNLRLDGKLAIVTGGYAGIGTETTRVLAKAGARVIVPARDRAKAQASVGSIPNVEIREMDLAMPSTIDAFAATITEPVHLLIHNAGIMAVPTLTRDARGIEQQLAVNHVGHFQLFTRLVPRLQAARGARVIAVSSRAHVRAPFDFEDPSFHRRDYEKMVAYGQSKTANILFAVEADRRYQGDGIRVFSLHPGAILGTDLGRFYDPSEYEGIVERSRQVSTFKTIPQGAATSVFAATSPMLEGRGGVYLVDCDIAKVGDDAHDVRPYATDLDNAKRLWAWTEQQL